MEPLEIIAVDDDIPSADYLGEVLLKTGVAHNFHALAGYMPLMEYLNADNTLPHLLILDVNMPVVSGFEALRILKSDEYLKRIPVIICSGIYRPADIEQSYEGRAHYFFIKPFSLKGYLKCFAQLLAINWHVPQPQPPRDKFVIALFD